MNRIVSLCSAVVLATSMLMAGESLRGLLDRSSGEYVITEDRYSAPRSFKNDRALCQKIIRFLNKKYATRAPERGVRVDLVYSLARWEFVSSMAGLRGIHLLGLTRRAPGYFSIFIRMDDDWINTMVHEYHHVLGYRHRTPEEYLEFDARVLQDLGEIFGETR